MPCAPVKSIREVDTDEHLIQRGMIQYVEHPAGAGCRSGMSATARRLADGTVAGRPPLGQSTAEVLAELRRAAQAADEADIHPTREEPRHVVHA